MRGIVGLIAGFLVGAIVAGGGIVYLVTKRDAEPLILPNKAFYDSRGPTGDDRFGYVAVSGTVSGEGIGYDNNHFMLRCNRSDGACEMAEFAQIGDRQLSGVTLERWPVVRWTDDLIVVRSDPGPDACSRVIVNILRGSEEVQYIRQPINPTSPTCQDRDMRLYRWSIENSPWRRMMEARSAR